MCYTVVISYVQTIVPPGLYLMSSHAIVGLSVILYLTGTCAPHHGSVSESPPRIWSPPHLFLSAGRETSFFCWAGLAIFSGLGKMWRTVNISPQLFLTSLFYYPCLKTSRKCVKYFPAEIFPWGTPVYMRWSYGTGHVIRNLLGHFVILYSITCTIHLIYL